MRAVQYRYYGAPLQPVDVPPPRPGANEVLIRVVAASVNPVDWKIHTGNLRLFMPQRLPVIPGFDVAGEVIAVGAGVHTFAAGDRVHARIRQQGAAAELCVAGLDVVARMPQGMDFATAAGVPLAGMTALQALRDVVGLPMTAATARVLVVGASGGVGHLGVQIARAAGAYVVGVCSAKNAELVRELGAHEVIDYAAADAYAGHRPFDVVFDCVDGAPGPWLPRMTPEGRFVSAVPGPAVMFRSLINVFTGQKVSPVMLKSNAADLIVLDELYRAGKLRVVVGARFPLAELDAAWALSRSGRARGKIVIDVALDA